MRLSTVALIETYWAIGEQLSKRVAEADRGKGVVKELVRGLGSQAPELKGFSASNLWRMMQFYETYVAFPKLATPLRELSWSKHLLLLSQCKPWKKGSTTSCRRLGVDGPIGSLSAK